jgi:hypothetical protein
VEQRFLFHNATGKIYKGQSQLYEDKPENLQEFAQVEEEHQKNLNWISSLQERLQSKGLGTISGFGGDTRNDVYI